MKRVALLVAILAGSAGAARAGKPFDGLATRGRFIRALVKTALTSEAGERGRFFDLSATPLPRRLRSIEGLAPHRVTALMGPRYDHVLDKVTIDALGPAPGGERADHNVTLHGRGRLVQLMTTHLEDLIQHSLSNATAQGNVNLRTVWGEEEGKPFVSLTEQGYAGVPRPFQRGQYAVRLPSSTQLPSGLRATEETWVVETRTGGGEQATSSFQLHTWSSSGPDRQRVAIPIADAKDRAFLADLTKHVVGRP